MGKRPSPVLPLAAEGLIGAFSARGIEFGFDPAHTILGPLDVSIAAGSRVALVGPSGSGKTTLLHLLAGVLQPTKGAIDFDGRSFSDLGQDSRARIRLERFGLVFQFAELVPELTLVENIELPSRIMGRRVDRQRVSATLEHLDILPLADQLPSQVSGGERQRAAVARAILHRPAVILADEPTGALDQANGERVLALLLDASRQSGATLVVVTHDQQVARQLDERIELHDGCIRG